MDWQVTTGPTIEPVTLAEAKLHLRVDVADDDTLITSLIKAARESCEMTEGRAYLEQSITAKLDVFEDLILLPRPPLISITSIKYLDLDGVQQTLATSYYDTDIISEPGIITLAYNQNWPNTRDVHHAIEIIYKAGYGSAVAAVPERVKSAMKLLLTYFYENRQPSDIDDFTAVQSLLNDRIFFS